MKKVFLLLIPAVILSFSASGQFKAAGGGLGLTSGFPFQNLAADQNRSSNLDIFLKGTFEMNLPVQFSPSLTFLIPHTRKITTLTDREKITVNVLMFDLNAHYVFYKPENFEFYALGGIDILLAGKKVVSSDLVTGNILNTTRESDNAIGLNAGGGATMKLSDQLGLFAEAKFLLGKYPQFMMNAGVLISLDQFIRKK